MPQPIENPAFWPGSGSCKFNNKKEGNQLIVLKRSEVEPDNVFESKM